MREKENWIFPSRPVRTPQSVMEDKCRNVLLQAQSPPNIKWPYGSFGIRNASQQRALWQIHFSTADKG